MAPRKLRLVADLIRGKRVEAAQNLLRFSKNKGAVYFLKLLNSALKNAQNNFQLQKDDFVLAKVLVDEGPKLKRWRARARGRAFPIQKKTSHLTISLRPIGEKTVSVSGKIKPSPAPEIVSVQKPKTEIIKRPQRPASPESTKPKSANRFQKFFRRKSF
jgi:large subunit ribosomal protein L22